MFRRLSVVLIALWLAVPLGADQSLAIPAPDYSAQVVGQIVTRILEQNHYKRHPLDKAASREHLKNYLETFDYNHLIFEKSDVDQFQSEFGDSLAARLKQGDVSAAYQIFERFLSRLEKRQSWVELFTSSPMSFDSSESAVLDRHELPWPANEKEAKELWRLRVKYEILQERLAKTKPEEQAKTVKLRYERLLRSYREYDSSDVLEAYLTALAHTFDPHSDYMASPKMDNFNISMRLSLVGIGAVLRSEDGYAKIVSLVSGGPADTDKRLKPNDRIEAIAQGDGPFIDAVGMKLDRLVQLIRGEKGTVVRLRVIPNDAIDPSTRIMISLVRDEIKLTDQEARAKMIHAPVENGRTAKIGVIDLPSFYADMKSVIEPKSTTRDVSRLIEALKKEGVAGLIIDLRRNGGGSLSEAVMLSGLFIPEGPIVQVKDTRQIVKVLRDNDPDMAYTGPIIILTSRASASASEIFAAAMQDYGRAVVVGEKGTFGKGTVQSVIELAQYLPGAMRALKPGAVKLTIQKFYRVSGGSTQNRGVSPDINLPSVDDYVDMTESSLPNALPYDDIAPAEFRRLDFVASEKLKELKTASEARVAASREFAYVLEDVARYKQQKEQKTISLNEKKRLREKQLDEERAQARKKERAQNLKPEFPSQDITLQILDGLPAPAKSTTTALAQTAGKDGEEDYEKAPPAPDYVLEESINILADLIGPNVASSQVGNPSGQNYIP